MANSVVPIPNPPTARARIASKRLCCCGRWVGKAGTGLISTSGRARQALVWWPRIVEQEKVSREIGHLRNGITR